MKPKEYENPKDRRVVPFEAEDGMLLGFNYWVTGKRQVIPADLQDLIIGILTGHKIPAFLRPRDMKARSVVVASITGPEHSELEGILKSGFLKTFSSVPTRYAENYGSKPSVSEVCAVEKLLFWREAPSIDLKTINGLSLDELFRKYALVFDVVHTYWNDSVVFSPEQRVEDKVRNAPIEKGADQEQDKLLNETGDSSKQANTPAQEKPVQCNGLVRRLRSGEKGRWFVEEDMLTIEWWNYPEDTLKLNCGHNPIIDTDKLSFSSVQLEPAASNNDSVLIKMDMELSCATLVPCDESVELEQSIHKLNNELARKMPSDAVLQSLCLNTEIMKELRIPYSKKEEQDSEFVELWPSVSMESTHQEEEHANDQNSELHQKFVAVDCEMSYTNAGLELTRVTLVNAAMEKLYDEIVKPTRPITDYNTQYSGISEEHMQGKTVSLKQVQQDLKRYIGPNTVIIGHSIDSDLRALKIIHSKIIDTSALYMQARGLPYKNSLKHLTKRYLGQEIQTGNEGHDSCQDAYATMQLALLKANKGPEFGVPDLFETEKFPAKESLFSSLSRLLEEPLRCKIIGHTREKDTNELWAQLCSSYKREEDPVWIGRAWKNENSTGKEPSKFDLEIVEFPSAKAILNEAVQVLGDNNPPDFVWLKLPYTSSPNHSEDCPQPNLTPRSKENQQTCSSTSSTNTSPKNSESSPATHFSSPEELDKALQALYEVAPDVCAMIVTVQPNLHNLMDASRKKVKSRWDLKSLTNKDYIAGSEGLLHTWDDNDEQHLIDQALSAMDGVTYLKCT